MQPGGSKGQGNLGGGRGKETFPFVRGVWIFSGFTHSLIGTSLFYFVSSPGSLWKTDFWIVTLNHVKVLPKTRFVIIREIYIVAPHSLISCLPFAFSKRC